MRRILERFLGSRPQLPGRDHLTYDTWPSAVYAIGDVHGCIDELRALEDMIVADAAGIQGDKWLVVLGDMIDRGPHSAMVLDHLLAPPPAGFQRMCLAGNHEVMMLEYWNRPSPASSWLGFGGLETLVSYGISQRQIASARGKAAQAILESHIPQEHREFLEHLPLSISVPGAVFVHAGIRRGTPMQLQTEADLLWIRDDFFNAPADDALLVVHGHTPGDVPVRTSSRICVDTGAFATGKLSAVRLVQQDEPHFLTTSGKS